MRIAVVAPGGRLRPEAADAIQALAATRYPANAPEIVFHPQCFLSHGHFAGSDAERAAALVEVANDPGFDAVWFGRGGYGSNRLLEAVIPSLGPAARAKAWLGYSDMGFLLAALYREGFERLAHGPMAVDIGRDGGEAAILRALAWLIEGEQEALEQGLLEDPRPAAAFNLTIFSQLIGTPWQPDLEGHVLMLEEVSEHHYRIDRSLFHVTSNPEVRRIAGLKLGRCSLIPENDPPFGAGEEAIAREWCARAGIPWLGRADIGHDSDNHVVPFGPR
jgi:muramoyltetrapeptide carboxypeptidase